MGRATSGVTGMKFRDGDELLTADVVSDDSYVFIVTDGGYAKRSSVEEYRVQNRGGLGIKVGKYQEERGHLVGGLIVQEEDEVLVVMEGGKVVRSGVAGVPSKGRDTMGVIFAKPDKNDRIIAVAKNVERNLSGELVDEENPENPEDSATSPVETAEDAVPLNQEKTESSEEVSGEPVEESDGGLS
jgi:DNA gyrase subunit A